MSKTVKRFFGKRAIFVVFLIVFGAMLNGDSHLTAKAEARTTKNDVLGQIHPGAAQRKLSTDIVRNLKYFHYREINLNDKMSSKIYDRYLSDLDPMRLYYRQTDINEFEKYRLKLDDALNEGELAPAFEIYNRYQERVIERLDFIINIIESGLNKLDFKKDDRIEVERKDAPWPKDATEQDELWRKRLKSDVLSLKLTGKSMDKISELLLKRYRSQLNRFKQQNSEDVFRLFMNAYSQTYDPHTLYFSPQLSENFNISMRLSLEGIGAVLQSSNEYTKIVRLIPAGPAEKSGLLKPGDRIVGVAQGDDEEMTDIVGWRLDDVVDLIRGPKNTQVRLQVIPVDAVDEHQTKIVKITRNTVKLEEQAAQKKVMDKTINGRKLHLGIIDIPTFYTDFDAHQSGKKNYRSTTRDVRRLLEELKTEKVDGVIVDLRDNSGGALQEAYEVTGLFIKDGPIVQVRGARGAVRVLDDPDDDIVYNGPLIVLINRMSASAAEIFAGAIQDYHRGIVVGTQTFGKGTVQTMERLRKGQLKMTRMKFYRVSGKSTQNLGILPDIKFPSIYDKKKIGESALPNALPWDSIRPASYHAYPDLTVQIEKLRQRHLKRVKNDPGFEYLNAGIKRLQEVGEKKWISLKEATRIKEREESDKVRLDLENMRRSAEGLPHVDKLPEEKLDEDGETLVEDESKKEDDFDPILSECENILTDYIQISSKAVAENAASMPSHF